MASKQSIVFFSLEQQHIRSATQLTQRLLEQLKVNYGIHYKTLELGFGVRINLHLEKDIQEQFCYHLQSTVLEKLHTNINYLYFAQAEDTTHIKLAAFDMDSTLIATEVIDELVAYAGMQEQVQIITNAAMRGEIDFAKSFEKRIALLKGIAEPVLQEIAQKLPLMPGLQVLFAGLAKHQVSTAIISGGFLYFADYLKELLGADYAYANRLEIVDGKLTGNYLGKIIGPNEKAHLLNMLAEELCINMENCLAVGDGANDLMMLQHAGVGIAFHAKPLLKEQVPWHIDAVSLDALLLLIDNSYANLN